MHAAPNHVKSRRFVKAQWLRLDAVPMHVDQGDSLIGFIHRNGPSAGALARSQPS